MSDNKHYDVGLVGWWFAANYGSVLTYYALGKVLKDMDLSSIMIRIPKMDGTGWEDITNKNIEFMKKYFAISEPIKFENMQECNQLCNSFMLGSDQLWVAFYNRLVGYTFFLDFVDENKKKIAYATSIGRAKYEGDAEDKKIVTSLLKRFDAISVRESSGVEICKEEFDVDAVRTLDPVFLCNKQYYDELAEASKIRIDEEYILCYILDPTEEKKNAIRLLEQKYGIKSKIILDMKHYKENSQKWSDENILNDVGVEEFIYAIKNCNYLLTDSHHGVCFAMIYGKNFSAISNARRGATRFDSLFNLFEISDLLMEEGEVLDRITSIPMINYGHIDKILLRERKGAEKWLKNALNNSNEKRNKCGVDLFAKYFNKAKRLENRKVDNQKIVSPNNIDMLNNNPDFIKIRILATLLRDYGVKHIVLSPGGRDVPLVRMFEYNQEHFILHQVTDERSAAYFGLGIAAQLQQPVVCVCTSGTAASNYLPAITEAYYTGVPLIVVTADRREVYLNHGEDQTIPQKNIYNNVVKKAISLPEGSGYHAEYQTRRDISECILEATHNGFGPVHINISIENITVGANASRENWKLLPRINPHILRVGINDGESNMMRWVDALKQSKRILIVYGQNVRPTERQRKNIEAFASKYNCVIVTDFISNLDCAYSLKPYNMLQAITNEEFNEQLSPDILITVGGKRLMNDPLTFKVRSGRRDIRHWSVTPDGKVKDFYFRLTSVIETSQDYFFEWFANHAGDIINDGVYYGKWKRLTEKYVASEINGYNSHYIQSRFIPAIPANSLLHLGVGQSFYDCRRFSLDKSVEVFCNMGTNGIDGCTSTFMGQCSVVKDKLCFLLVGDLSFFYDMNSIWNKQLDKNIRILLVNNNGTGLLRGHNLKSISSVHNTTAKGWVESTGFEYISANTKEEFEQKLRYFISNEPQKALFFEVLCE